MTMVPKVLNDLGVFFNSGETAQSLSPAVEALGLARLRVAVIRLLEWLRLQARTKSRRPLTIQDSVEWSKNVCDLINVVSELEAIFTIRNNELDFRDDVTESDREEIRQFSKSAYQPRLMQHKSE